MIRPETETWGGGGGGGEWAQQGLVLFDLRGSGHSHEYQNSGHHLNGMFSSKQVSKIEVGPLA